MRKLAALAGATLLALGGGTVAAQDGDYPGDDAVLLLSPASVAPGGEFAASLVGCVLGETVEFTVEGDSASATCEATDDGGTAAHVMLTAPSAAGEYPVTGTGLSSGVTSTSILTVVGDDDDDGDDDGDEGAVGGLPETGSDSGVTMQIASGAVIAGVGLLAVAWFRRRPRTA